MNDAIVKDVRAQISELRSVINRLKESVPQDQGSLVIPELVIANRHLEDARMRIGVAAAYANGHNPWSDEKEENNE